MRKFTVETNVTIRMSCFLALCNISFCCPATGGQAVQMAKAGLQSIYLSGWQVAADSNMAGQTYPDQSLYPANSAAKLVERINNAFIRADQIAHMEGSDKHIDFFLPIVADCEAGFGGPLNAFELTKAMVRFYFCSHYFLNFQAE